MKELNRTDRLNIAVILIMVILTIGLITLSPPDLKYSVSSESMLEELFSEGNLVTPGEIDSVLSGDTPEHFFIDVRNPYEYHKSHLVDAVNIPLHDILEPASTALFDSLSEASTTMVVYGSKPTEANAAWMMLRQLGYENTRAVSEGYVFYRDLKMTGPGTAEGPGFFLDKAAYDFRDIVEEAGGEVTGETPAGPEMVMPKRKKRKNTVEGGC